MNSTLDINAARTHFKIHDPIMYDLLILAETHSAPLLLPTPKQPRFYFAAVASSIVSQQISTKAAAAVLARLKAHVGTLTPATIAATTEEGLRSCGLSGQKARYLKTKNISDRTHMVTPPHHRLTYALARTGQRTGATLKPYLPDSRIRAYAAS